MSEASKAVARRIYVEAFNHGRLETLDEIITGDAVDHSPTPTPPVTCGPT